MANNMQKYDDAVVRLSAQDQLALLLSIDTCFLCGLSFNTFLERVISHVTNPAKKAVWTEAGIDLAAGKEIYEILVKTGFFSTQIEAIFLTVQEPNLAIKSALKFLGVTSG